MAVQEAESSKFNIPSGFDIIQALSQCVLRNWPPATNLAHTPRGPPNVYDAALMALQYMEEDIIGSFRKIAGGIQVARNRASPVFRLPIEVFRRVFAHLEGDMRDQISVAHSCSLWRTIISEDPFLWTTVNMDTIHTPEIASKVFRAAKDYPVRLRCREWNELRLQCVALEMPRVEELEIGFTVSTFQTLCKVPAPLLRRFVIAVPEHSNMFIYLPYVFSNTHPLLTDLTMVDCRLLITPENYCDLTKLNIRFTRSMPLRQDEDFACILRGSPKLEELKLENVNLFREYHEPTEVIHLQYLRIMHLRLTVRDLKCILSAVSAPPTLRLSMAPGSVYRTSNQPPVLAQIAMPSSPSLALLTETTYLDVDPTKHGIFTYRDTTARLLALSYRSISPMASVPVDPEATSSDLTVLANLYAMPTLERVRTRDTDPAALVKLLKKCPSITDLELIYTRRGIGNSTVIPAIMRVLHTSTEPFLPNLQTMRLQEVYIDVETLSDLMELRRACSELRHLFLYSCQGDLPVDEMLDILRTEFDIAEWKNQPHFTDHNYRHQPTSAARVRRASENLAPLQFHRGQ
ncbi:hypothetical protein BDY19DRAFT_1059480 [Irpex rosettiformis]|uniref:Uncharacterized protein n=1 Tax=Irpex rosettiformis TaxID=378272 RepID=A0ACB8TUV8_9APHY|nr:hypothetical protein BDY19DRAFT_1059480 [Irpex rosettiformis]